MASVGELNSRTLIGSPLDVEQVHSCSGCRCRSSKYSRANWTPPLNRWSPPHPGLLHGHDVVELQPRVGVLLRARCAALVDDVRAWCRRRGPRWTACSADSRSSVSPFMTLNDDSNTSLVADAGVSFACVDEAGLVCTSDAMSGAGSSGVVAAMAANLVVPVVGERQLLVRRCRETRPCPE